MVGKPVSMAMLAQWPVINGGTYLNMYANWDGGSFGGAANLGAIKTSSTAMQWQQFTITVPPLATYIEFSTATNTNAVTSDLLIAAQRFVCGMDTTPYPLPAFPELTISFANEAPTTGFWVRGDRVVNSEPGIGSPKSWVCTVLGRPGTWVSEGSL